MDTFNPDPTTDDGELFPDWAMTAMSLMTRFEQFRPIDMDKFGRWDDPTLRFLDFVEHHQNNSPHCAEGCTEADFSGGDCTADWMPWDQARIDAIRARREARGQ
jgi:hypothetical protein